MGMRTNLVPAFARMGALYRYATMFVSSPDEASAVHSVIPDVLILADALCVVADILGIAAFAVAIGAGLAGVMLARFDGSLLAVRINRILVVEDAPPVVVLDIVL